MISLTAVVRPAHDVGSYVLRDVSARLREFDHVLCAPGQILVTVPQLGTALLTESRTLLTVHIMTSTEDAAARACAALLRELRNAVGSVAASRDLSVGWTREEVGVTARF